MRLRSSSSGELAQVHAIQLDPAGLRVVEPAQELDQRALARAVGADDGRHLAGRDREVQVVQHGARAGAARVAEGDAVEADGGAEGRKDEG